MSATAATAGYAATLGYRIGTGAITKVAGVTNLTLPKLTGSPIDISNRDSVKINSVSPIKEYISGWVEPGQIEVTAIYTPAQYATLVALLGVMGYLYVLDFGDKTGAESTNSTLTIPGFLNEIGPDAPLENGAETLSLAFKLTGGTAPVFTAAS